MSADDSSSSAARCVALLCVQCQLAELKQMACTALGLAAEAWEVFDYRGGQQGDCVSGRRLCCTAGPPRGGGMRRDVAVGCLLVGCGC